MSLIVPLIFFNRGNGSFCGGSSLLGRLTLPKAALGVLWNAGMNRSVAGYPAFIPCILLEREGDQCIMS